MFDRCYLLDFDFAVRYHTITVTLIVCGYQFVVISLFCLVVLENTYDAENFDTVISNAEVKNYFSIFIIHFKFIFNHSTIHLVLQFAKKLTACLLWPE